MIALDLKNQVLDLEGQMATLPIGPATAIGQPFKTRTLVSIEDFVAGFARDIELAAPVGRRSSGANLLREFAQVRKIYAQCLGARQKQPHLYWQAAVATARSRWGCCASWSRTVSSRTLWWARQWGLSTARTSLGIQPLPA
jgi:hypothetical protein